MTLSHIEWVFYALLSAKHSNLGLPAWVVQSRQDLTDARHFQLMPRGVGRTGSPGMWFWLPAAHPLLLFLRQLCAKRAVKQRRHSVSGGSDAVHLQKGEQL